MPNSAVGRPGLFIFDRALPSDGESPDNWAFPDAIRTTKRDRARELLPIVPSTQCSEGGHIFAEPPALPVLGAAAEAAVRIAENDPSRQRLCLSIALRTGFAEAALTAEVAPCPPAGGTSGRASTPTPSAPALGKNLHVFEADQPATQAGKLQRLGDRAIPVLARSPSLQSISSGRLWRTA